VRLLRDVEQLGAESDEERLGEGLCEKISDHVSGWKVLKAEVSMSDEIADEMMTRVDVF
jgi:hypothetical protein